MTPRGSSTERKRGEVTSAGAMQAPVRWGAQAGETLLLFAVLLVGGAAVGAASPQERATPARPDDAVTVADAARELETQLQQEPGNAKLHVLLGLARMREDDDRRALESFMRAVELAPDSAEARNWLGVALVAQSDLPRGIAVLRIELDGLPQFGDPARQV
jgi:cytochrome c-type biogenesis protein CcmH/NrfG